MPGPHRLFLEHVSKIANIREYVTSYPEGAALDAAYDHCLGRLVAFRNKHVQIVSRYIVVPSRVSQRNTASNNPAKGTGGTAPVDFLKQIRDETRESLFLR